MSLEVAIGLEDVELAARRLKPYLVRTPLLPVPELSELLSVPVYVKAENLQRTGSFKFRGAFNKIASLPEAARRQGVITYSSGNHGLAVAYAGKLLGVPVHVVLPEDAVPRKIEAAKRAGAEVVLHGHTSLERKAAAEAEAEKHGYTVVPPFDDWQIIAGQATIALEILQDLNKLAAVLAPVGGGGLLSGIALACAWKKPDVAVFGVEPAGADDARRSLESGRRVVVDHPETIADGLRTSTLGERNFAVLQRHVRGILTVEDDAILRAVRFLFQEAKLVVEPSGAAALAALLALRPELPGPVAVVLSGGNLDIRLMPTLFGGNG